MTDEDWAKFEADFASAELFTVVDSIDELRGHLNDGDRHAPHEIRTDALKLQVLAASVLNEGGKSRQRGGMRHRILRDAHLQLWPRIFGNSALNRAKIGPWSCPVRDRASVLVSGSSNEFSHSEQTDGHGIVLLN